MQQSQSDSVTLRDIERQESSEEIPLQEITRTQLARHSSVQVEHQKRAKARELFEQYDVSNDGFLSVKEMKRLIKDHGCDNLPKCAAKKILTIGDTNGDGKLSFEEFYILCTQSEWVAKSYAIKYCKLIVPRRAMAQDADEIDGAYENSMTFCPPPLTMVIFSLIEIIFFVIDVISLEELKQGNNGKPIGTTTNGPAAQLFIYNPYKREQGWRFITYMFVHVGVMHLTMNLIGKAFKSILVS